MKSTPQNTFPKADPARVRTVPTVKRQEKYSEKGIDRLFSRDASFFLRLAFADGDAANLFKTHCQGCHGADGGRVPASGIEPIKGQSAPICLKKLEGYKGRVLWPPNASWSWKNVVKQLSDEQLKSLADYASTL